MSLEITCNFGLQWYGYACEITHINSLSSDDYTVTKVIGHHQRGYTSNEVTGIDGRSKTIQRFLIDLTRFFPNLDTIFFEKGMTEIHKEELAYYPKLKKLYLSFNELEVIESDLFINNPNLELVYLGVNKIHTVYPKVFDGLTKMTSLRFQNNTCYDGQVDHNRNEAVKFAQNIYKHCAPSTAAGQCESEIVTVKKEVQKLTSEIKEWKKEISDFIKIMQESCSSQ